eukprot:GEMP01054475.1.p1 GENE.GEMP01054475.1~~GEMP01054475.1.p1  ORF type:complete len:430 (+),score=49.90 GEMP01054475.1:28-1290(+)
MAHVRHKIKVRNGVVLQAMTLQTLARRGFSTEIPSGAALQEALQCEIATDRTSMLPSMGEQERICALVNQCRMEGLRAFSELADIAQKVDCSALPTPDLVNLLRNYSSLGCLHAPLFMSASSAVRAADLQGEYLVSAAESYASQRLRDVDLFASWSPRWGSLSAADQVRIRHACASLRIPCDLRPSVTNLPLNLRAQLAEAVLLDNQDLTQLLEVLATLEIDEKTAMSKATHRRLLLLRSGLRYLHKDAYNSLPEQSRDVLRAVHHREMDPPMLKCTSFVENLSHALTKLKIAHRPRVLRGPFIFDILERDRKLVYETNHKDRFYALTFEKIASRQLQERVVKAMGYRVVQIPYWHWNKLRIRRTRMEYIRMSRYYAIKDRREYSLRDEEFLGEYFFRKDRPITPFAWSIHKDQVKDVEH